MTNDNDKQNPHDPPDPQGDDDFGLSAPDAQDELNALATILGVALNASLMASSMPGDRRTPRPADRVDFVLVLRGPHGDTAVSSSERNKERVRTMLRKAAGRV